MVRAWRSTEELLSSEPGREVLLSQALAELGRWRERYRALDQLAAVFAAADEVMAAGRSDGRRKGLAGEPRAVGAAAGQ